MPEHEVRFGSLGQLAYDELEDAFECHLCGAWKRNLGQHSAMAHRLPSDDYRALAGLNRTTRLLVPSLRQHLREITAPLIARLRAEGKLRRWNEDPEKWADDKAAAVAAIREGLSMEASANRRASFSEGRRQAAAERLAERNRQPDRPNTPELVAAGVKRYFAEHPEARDAARGRLNRQPRPPERDKYELRCQRCGVAFAAKRPHAKYCLPCRPRVADQRTMAWRRKQSGPPSPPPPAS